jgi:hypothetical protein
MIIKFSHLYNKMPRDFQHSKLLDVLPIELEDLSLDFLLYDTSYLDGGEEKQYALPAKGAYMILLLQAGSGKGQLWTTIRSQWPPSKLEYYKSKIGEICECQIT